MIKEIEISVPTSYGDITLKKWIELQKEIKNYEGDDDAITALMLYHLCGLDPKYIKGLSMDAYKTIRTELGAFIQNVKLPLQRFITIDGVEYGFEPNLSKMAYGAYVDISKYETMEMDEKWADIMSILYRPVKQKVGKFYDTMTYDGNINGDKFLDLGMDVHWGTLFFLKSLLKDLSSDIQKSLMESMEIPHNIKSILAKSGNLTLP